jgi:hypothetical protein
VAGRAIKREEEARILGYDVGQFSAGYVDMRRMDWKDWAINVLRRHHTIEHLP